MDNVIIDEESGVAFEVVDDNDVQNPLRAQTEEEATDTTARTNVLVEEHQEPAEGGEEEGEGEEAPAAEGEEPVEDDEEFLELDEKLDAYLEEQINERIKPAVSGRDRQISLQQTQLAELKAQQVQLQKDIREAKIAGISPAEQEKMRAVWADDDRRNGLDEYQQKLDSFYLDLKRVALAQDYAEFGVSADALESILDEEEMEKFCNDAELAHWRAVAQGKKAPSAAARAAGVKSATSAPAKAAVNRVARPVPAGASAPSDAGGGEPLPPTTRKPSDGVGVEAMAATFEALPYANVRFRQ